MSLAWHRGIDRVATSRSQPKTSKLLWSHPVEQSRDIGFDEEAEMPDWNRAEAQDAAPVDSVRAYHQQIGKVVLLTAQQEVDLAKRIEAGLYAGERLRKGRRDCPAAPSRLLWIARDGERAKNQLVEANLRLVLSVTKHYTGRDMVLQATYATWWIRQEHRPQTGD